MSKKIVGILMLTLFAVGLFTLVVVVTSFWQAVGIFSFAIGATAFLVKGLDLASGYES